MERAEDRNRLILSAGTVRYVMETRTGDLRAACLGRISVTSRTPNPLFGMRLR